jgi:DNA-directed RNA polymerase specialized sigma24 family protein
VENDRFLGERFEAERAHLRSVAYRILGSRADADDAIQEAWLRLSRSETGDVENLRVWLTTVVARVCLDVLRSPRRDGRSPAGRASRGRPFVMRPEVTPSATPSLAIRSVLLC